MSARPLLLGCVALAGCGGARNQSALAPEGPVAGEVASLWWFALAVATAVYLATVGALAWAAWRARRRAARGEATDPARDHRRMTVAVSVGGALTVVILLGFFVRDLAAARALRIPVTRDHVKIRVTGHQWWWSIEYPHPDPSQRVTDANELHVPTGIPVLVEVTSHDVIHSLWAPNLAGKKDLIPRYVDTLWFQVDRPGVYGAQCAEFCGHQHAKMALPVVAHAPRDYAGWLARARRPAAEPSDSMARRGREIFLSGPCALCHAITGTPAGSRVGPELTHLASRRTLAAGTLPNGKGNLAAWILDPQRIKPGTAMPATALPPADLEALLAYLGGLQ